MRQRGWGTPDEQAEGLFDRDLELDRLRQGVDAAARGSGSVLAIVGSAGMGKTELLRATRLLAGARGFTVLAARGGELEREMPFGVARQLLEPALLAVPACSGCAPTSPSAARCCSPSTTCTGPTRPRCAG